jgi:LPXTG-motif cell wall-anchored protein
VSVVSSARLADTGSTTPMWPIAGAGMLLVAGVAALGFARLRASRTR